MLISLRKFILELCVFICGAVVMIYEIIGSRIVAPYIGTSTYVWTSLIGIILAALSVGYWIGGRIADKRPDVKVLAGAIFAAGGLVSLTILIKDFVLSVIGASPGGLEVKSVAAAALLFAPASVLLGFVTPFAVKLRTTSLDESGSTVGRLYALSTIGSISGTFLAGFILIPFAGSTRTLYLVAGSLFAVSIMLAPFAFTRVNLMIISLFTLGIAGSELTSYHARNSLGIHDLDTEYSRVQIFQNTDQETGRRFQAVATDPFFAQSAMYLDDGSAVFKYIPFYHLAAHLFPEHQHSLMIGGAGYTFPKEYLRTYPDAKMDVVEIDPQMTAIARRFFRLEDDPHLSIFHEDGRVFLNNAPSDTYDTVMIDAFGSLFSIPYQLTTIEAVRHIERILKKDGAVIFNVGTAIRGPGSLFLQAELLTYRQVFREVHMFKVDPARDDNDLQNVIVVACKSICRVDLASDDPLQSSLLSKLYKSEIPINVPILTDDLAPVEYYNSLGREYSR